MTTRALAIAAVLMLCRASSAEPDPAKLAALLRQGREQTAAHAYARAIVTFEQYLAIDPDNATVLGELGWTAFLAKDYAKAKAATEKAIARQPAPDVRGAAFYNLGQIAEAQHDTAAAIAAYIESLRARPNATVRAALNKLDDKAAAAFDAYDPRPFAGPFSSSAGLCKSLPATHAVFESPAEDCACYEIPHATRKLAPPFEAVAILRRGCGYHEATDGFAEFGFVEYELAIKVAAGWFVQTVGESDLLGHGGERLTIESIRQPALGTGPSVAIAYRIAGHWYHRAEARDWDRTDVVVVGVGPSGKPSGTPPIAQTRLETDEDNGITSRPVDVAFNLSWSAGALTVTATRTTGLDRATTSDLVGPHRLAFP